MIVELAVLFLAHTEDNFFPRLTLFLLLLLLSLSAAVAATVNGEETEHGGRTDGQTDLGPMKESDEARVPREQRSGAARRREKTRLPEKGERLAKSNLKCRNAEIPLSARDHNASFML